MFSLSKFGKTVDTLLIQEGATDCKGISFAGTGFALLLAHAILHGVLFILGFLTLHIFTRLTF